MGDQTTSQIVSVILFLSIGTNADILVQPGYGQPHPVVQPGYGHQHPLVHTYTAAQKPIGNQHSSATLVNNAYQPSASVHGYANAPYYLEVQPVYLNQAQSQNQLASHLQWHQPQSYYSSYLPQSHLHYAKIAGYSYPQTSVFAGQPQISAVHNRHRRSADAEPTPGGKSTENDKLPVASQSALNPDFSPINYSENRDNEYTKDLNEKYVGIRESKNDQDVTGTTLLGLDPTQMNPGQQQYASEDDGLHQSQTRHTSRHKSHHGVDIVGESAQFKSGNSNWRIVSPEGQILELAPTQRNFPDPRPYVTESSKSEKLVKLTNPNEVSSDDSSGPDEIVGTSRRKLNKLHGLKHHHVVVHTPTSHPYYTTAPYTNCPQTYTPPPTYVVVKNDPGCYSNLGVVQTAAQTPSQVYQISYTPQTTASLGSNYIVYPQTSSAYTSATYPSNLISTTYYA